MTPTQIVQAIYDAFKRGDIPYILSQLASDVTWHQTSAVPWGGHYKGPEHVAQFFQKLDAAMETMAFEANENIEAGNEVFSFGRYAGRSRVTGRTGEMDWMFRWRVVNGQLAAWDSYIDSAPLVAAMDPGHSA